MIKGRPHPKDREVVDALQRYLARADDGDSLPSKLEDLADLLERGGRVDSTRAGGHGASSQDGAQRSRESIDMMIAKLVEKVVGEKRQWREYKARARQLPPGYRTAVEALERYLMYFGGGGDGTAIFADLVDLFEQGAANETPIRQIVGDDPVDFIETFVRNYPPGKWVVDERRRLIDAIERAASGEA